MLDGHLATKRKFNYRNGVNMCGAHHNNWKEEVYTFQHDMVHASENLEVGVYTSLNQVAADESWGLRRVQVWIVPSADWVEVAADTFTETAVDPSHGWNGVDRVTQCGNIGPILGGYNVLGHDSFVSKRINLDRYPHTHIRIQLGFVKIDEGAHLAIHVDDERVASIEYSKKKGHQLCGSTEKHRNEWLFDFDHIVAHGSDSVSIRLSTNKSKNKHHEFWGISYLKVTVAPTEKWLTVYDDSFENNSTHAWAGTDQITKCGAFTMLGGFGVMGKGGALTKTFDLSDFKHSHVKVEATLWKIDSWDNEHLLVFADHNNVYNHKLHSNSGQNVCGQMHKGWNEYAVSFSRTIAHMRDSLHVRITSTLNQGAKDESWGLQNLVISVSTAPSASLVHGVCAEHYENKELTGPFTPSVVPTLALNGAVPNAARYNAVLRVAKTSMYGLSAGRTNGVVRVLLEDVPVIDTWSSSITTSDSIQLSAGTDYLLTVEFAGDVDRSLTLLWSEDGGEVEPIPESALFRWEDCDEERGVVLYDGPNYTGKARILSEGHHSVAEVNVNAVDSVKIPCGYSVVLEKSGEFYKVLTESIDDSESTGEIALWDAAVTSLSVHREADHVYNGSDAHDSGNELIVPGLCAEYFSNRNLDAAGITFFQIDHDIHFKWKDNAPIVRFPRDNFSVRWTGKLRVDKTASYKFYVWSDDGARVYVDGAVVIDYWKDHSAEFTEGLSVHLIAGHDYDIKIEYFEGGGLAEMSLYWSVDGGDMALVPASSLFTDAATCTGADGVTLYDDIAFTGLAQVFDVGQYDLRQLHANDVISSVRVPAGYQITLFEHKEWKGRSVVLESDAYDLSRSDPTWDNIVSSIIVSHASQVDPADDSHAHLPDGAKSGLCGYYFANQKLELTSDTQTRVDRAVNFKWRQNGAFPTSPKDHFSVRWTGQLRIPVSGEYVFWVKSDDGSKLRIGGKTVVDAWVVHPPKYSGTTVMTLFKGDILDMELEYFEQSGGAQIQLLWSINNGGKHAVPPTVFSHTQDCGSEIFCQAQGEWARTAAGTNATAPCGGDQIGYRTRKCELGGNFLSVDTSACLPGSCRNNTMPVVTLPADINVEAESIEANPSPQPILLDGTESYDMDSDELDYHWTILQKPAGSDAHITFQLPHLHVYTSADLAAIVVDEYGVYEVELSISDECWTKSARIKVTYQP
eukprot:GFYU01001022.1.p1 GENE.GFYU01001022.1~~GFYU01001022.1.p1  ORF type:complete len:1352 (-),score=396.68 GFYU01001022.1:117-3695(-)